MSLEGVDYSFGRPGGAALAAAGKAFACRYLTGAGKALQQPELTDLFNHGISVVGTFESTAKRALEGWSAGAEDASDAKTAADRLGFPTDSAIYFAVDFNAQTVQQGRIDQYLKGVASVIGLPRVGVYGSYAVCTRTKGNKTASWWWQAKAWSGLHIAPWAHLYQWKNTQSINGSAVDFDRAMQSNYGQWPAPPSGGPAVEVDVIYTRGGLQTVDVGDNVKYSHEPGGPLVGPVKPGTYFARAFDASGHNVAIDGEYLDAPGNTPAACGWITTGQISNVKDVIVTPDCTAQIAADRAKARIVYTEVPA